MPPAKTERFEMRLEEEMLARVDRWRSLQAGVPTRTEAIRMLIDASLTREEDPRREVDFSDGEKLTVLMLGEILEKLGVDTATPLELLRQSIYGGHYWALGMEMGGVLHGRRDRQRDVEFVTSVLAVWDHIESAYAKMDSAEKAQLEKEAGPFGEDPKFRGFDGNNEGELYSIATMLIEHMGRYPRFRKRGLNSHMPTRVRYARMVQAFKPIRENLGGREMKLSEIATVLKAARAPD